MATGSCRISETPAYVLRKLLTLLWNNLRYYIVMNTLMEVFYTACSVSYLRRIIIIDSWCNSYEYKRTMIVLLHRIYYKDVFYLEC